MPAQWTGDIIGKMHLHGVNGLQLAQEIGWNAKYLSAVLNGRRTPKRAETVLNEALDAIIERKGNEANKNA